MTVDRILTPDEILPPDDGPPPLGPRRRRVSRRRRQRRRRLVAVVVVLLALAAGAWHFDFHARVPVAVKTWRDIALVTPPAVRAPIRQARPRYHHSVVPGGVFDRTELEVAVATDPVVAEHYADFDVSRTRVTRLDAPRAVYVSYRVGDRVYWTRDKVWLRPGEALLTDGVTHARGRCGNRVSDYPAEPVAPVDPPLKVLDQPVEDPPPGIEPLRGYALMFTEVPEAQPPVPPVIDPLPSEPVSIVPPPPPLIVERFPEPPPPMGPVPEPGTLLLVGSGAAAWAARRWRRRAR